MAIQNNNFIRPCELCGRNELILSEIKLICGYGSINDGAVITLAVCGNCIDKFCNMIFSDKQ